MPRLYAERVTMGVAEGQVGELQEPHQENDTPVLKTTQAMEFKSVTTLKIRQKVYEMLQGPNIFYIDKEVLKQFFIYKFGNLQ